MTEVPPPPEQPMLSPDGRWRWDGSQWVANEPAPPPPSYPSPPPVARATAADAGPASPGWVPPPMTPTPRVPMVPAASAPPVATAPPPMMPPPPGQAWGAAPTAARGLAYQFSGNAMWSIIFGLVSVVVPLVSTFYFPILPLFGLWRGVLALQRGRVAGGVIGLILNVLGALVSLLASGLLFR